MNDPSLSETVDSLARALLTDDDDLQAALKRVAEAGCALLTNCDAASVTVIERTKPMAVASTNDIALALDESQYRSSSGPCLTAAVEDHIIRIEDMTVEDRWPEFRDAARSAGIASSLSVPMRLHDSEYQGGFNMYSRSAAGFTEADEQLATAFADQASIAVANTRAYWRALEMTKNLTAAMDSREIIEQAKGVLMATYRMDADAAFTRLRQQSQAENRKLRDVAADIVGSIAPS